MKTIKNMIFIALLIFFILVIINSYNLNYTGNIVKENFNTGYAVNNIDTTVSEYNERFERIPNFVRTMFGNERINLIINMNDNSIKRYSIITKEGKIISYSEDLIDKPSVIITTSEETIDSIASSDNPADEFADAIENKKIEIKSKGVINKLKLFTAKSFLKIRSIF